MKRRRKIRVYLDTSVISALFDERNPERKSLTEAFFAEIGNFETFISEITVAKIERTPDMAIRSKMKDAVSRFSVLSLTDDVEWVAHEYIRHGAVPESYSEDAYHIAIAVINEVGYLLSWNFKHIVRMVNTLNNSRQIETMAPAELL